MENVKNYSSKSNHGLAVEMEKKSKVSQVEETEFVEASGRPSQVSFHIENMHCGSCVSRIEGALETVPTIVSYSVDLKGQRVDVDYQMDIGSLSLIQTAIESTGHKILEIFSK